jgi:hypothetical protein
MWKLYKIKSEENISGIEETKGTIVSFFYYTFFFINVAKDIGSSNTKSDQSHPSIQKIIANTPDIEHLVFLAVYSQACSYFYLEHCSFYDKVLPELL